MVLLGHMFIATDTLITFYIDYIQRQCRVLGIDPSIVFIKRKVRCSYILHDDISKYFMFFKLQFYVWIIQALRW